MRNWVLALVPLVLLCSGCWDRIEVEERAYVLGVALDVPKDRTQRKVTIAMPLAREVGTATGKGGSEKLPLTTFDAIAPTVQQALSPLQNKMNRSLSFGHQKVLLFSEESARYPLSPWLDFFERFSKIPRTTLVAVCEGKASELLSVAPASELLPPLYLHQLLLDVAKYGFGPHRTLNQVACYFESKSPGLLVPLIKKSKDSVEVAGSAVLRYNKSVGTMDKYQTRGAMWLTGEVGRGTISFPQDQGLNQLSFEIKNARRQIKARSRKDGITFEVKVTVEGTVEEYFGSRNVMNPQVLEQAERELERIIRAEIDGAVEILQNKLRTDALGFGIMVRKRNPKLWQQVGEWNRYFAENVEIKVVDLTVFIRRTGVLR